VGTWFGFRTPPFEVMAGVAALVVAYLLCAELLKRFAFGPAASRRRSGP
jgi:P-type Mg2+ transporter